MAFVFWYAIGLVATVSGFVFCVMDLPTSFLFSALSVREFGFGLFITGASLQGAVFLSLLQTRSLKRKLKEPVMR